MIIVSVRLQIYMWVSKSCVRKKNLISFLRRDIPPFWHPTLSIWDQHKCCTIQHSLQLALIRGHHYVVDFKRLFLFLAQMSVVVDTYAKLSNVFLYLNFHLGRILLQVACKSFPVCSGSLLFATSILLSMFWKYSHSTAEKGKISSTMYVTTSLLITAFVNTCCWKSSLDWCRYTHIFSATHVIFK